jgi:excisionase family DNA binding protein
VLVASSGSPNVQSILEALQMTKNMPSLLSIKEIANLANVSIRTINRQIDAGHLGTPIRIGRAVRFQRDLIDRWIANGCKPVRTVA